MSIVMTATARVRDWKALEALNQETLIAAARAVGARRYGTYRNVYDASQVLLFIELPDYDAVQEMGRTLFHYLEILQCDDVSQEQTWEPMDWLRIE